MTNINIFRPLRTFFSIIKYDNLLGKISVVDEDSREVIHGKMNDLFDMNQCLMMNSSVEWESNDSFRVVGRNTNLLYRVEFRFETLPHICLN